MSQQVRVYRLLDFNYANINPDSSRTYPLMRIGDRINELDVRMTATLAHWDPIQLNLNIVGVAPTSDTTINTIYSNITHDTTNMSGLRLKCADWVITIAKQVKDVYVIQTELIKTGADLMSGEVFAGSFYLNLSSSSFTVTSRIAALMAIVSGSATVTVTDNLYSVALIIASGGAKPTALLALQTDATATATDGLLIDNGGTMTNAVKVKGSVAVFADFDDASGEICTESGGASTNWAARIHVKTPDGNDGYVNVWSTKG